MGPLYIIPGYNPGDDITLINVYYERPAKLPNGKYDTDYLTVVFKDNTTGEKHMHTFSTPKFRYYIKKPEYSNGLDYNAEWSDLKEVDPVICNYKDVSKDIATRLGFEKEYKENLYSGNYRLNDVYLTHPRIFAADMNILNFFRMEFAATYKNNTPPISIAYYDIENDIIDAISDKPVIGECPINMISIIFDKTQTIYSFIMRDKNNPQIEELEKEISKDPNAAQIQVLQFLHKVHGEEKASKYKLDKLKLSVGFFDNEISMILTFFNVMHQLSPDFAVAFNAAYDLNYLVARMEKYGIDPRDVVCDKDSARKFYYYKVDDKEFDGKFKEFKERGDYVMCASRITWLDQLIIYASRRKGGAANKSYSLDDTVDKECGIHKLDWSPYAKRFADFCRNNYKVFWLYNINDTVVQYCLEQQTNDILFMFNNTLMMNAPYQKIFRQTNYLISKMTEFYKDHENVVIGVNTNRFKPRKDNKEKFPGAFVAEPTKISDLNKMRSHGVPIMRFNNGDDFDYKALYPSLMREFNMSASTQIGKILMDNPPYKGAEFLRIGAGGHYVENLASYNFIEFAHRWLKLPNIEEMLHDVRWYFENMRTPFYKKNNDSLLPMDRTHKQVMMKVDTHRPLVSMRPMPEWVKQKVDEMRKGIRLQ